MIKTLMVILLSSMFILAQNDEKENPNVELPDFVITGTEKISVEKVKKIEPELITTLSEEFIKPSHSPEELELRRFSSPITKDINFNDSVHYQNGYFDAAVGLYNIPSGRLFYSSPFSGGIFSASLDALNKRAHVEESDRYELGGDIEGKFFTNTNSSFLPGSQYRLKGSFNTDSYKFYGSLLTPEEKRSVNSFSGLASYSNFQSKYFQTALELNNTYTHVTQEEYKENHLDANWFGKLVLENFTLSGNAGYQYNSLSNSLVTGINTNYISLFPRIGLDVSELFKVEFGFSFSNALSQTYFNPYASIGLKLDKNFTMYGEFFPHAELLSASSFLKENPYLDLNLSREHYVKYSTDIKVGVRYEYQKFFQINGGINLKGSANYPYFNNSAPLSTDNYKFAVYTTDTKILTSFVDLLYHLGPFGYLYGKGELNVTRDSLLNYLPYTPQVKANAAYGYSFSKAKLDTEIRFTYASEVYTDLTNQNKLPSYVDLGLKFAYQYGPKFFITLEFANILQHENYRWLGYKEQPVNVSAGFHLIF